MARQTHILYLLVAALFVPTCLVYAQTTTAPPASSAPSTILVELAKALGWPVALLIVAAVFRQPISVFLGAIGSRITKLSIFKVELELVPAKAVTSTPLLDDIRSVASSAELNDSSRMMLQQVQIGAPADYAVVALGEGKEWLTSRLYIAAVMMERMRGLQTFVIVERAPTTERRFVAVASVRQLRWALAQRYPWLEAAWAHANMSVFPHPQVLALNQPSITSDLGAFEPHIARAIVSKFLESVQEINVVTSPANPNEWVSLRGSTRERAAYVTRELVASLLPQTAFDAWTDAQRDASRARKTRAVLRRTGDFVALVVGDREFVRLSNRRALLEEIAVSLGEEPENT